MVNKTLAIIMAAGYGTRMGNTGMPKTMLPDSHGRPFIEDAFTFFKYKSGSLDFIVVSRDEALFDRQNAYLQSHPVSNKFIILYQKSGPREHLTAFILESFLSSDFKGFISSYDRIILLPGDHKLTSSELNLDELVEEHKKNQAHVTAVYSAGVGDSSAKTNLMVVDSQGRIKYIDPKNVAPNAVDVTGVGVWVLNNSIVNYLRVMASYASYKINNGKVPDFARLYAYFIEPGWSGGRDTPSSIGK